MHEFRSTRQGGLLAEPLTDYDALALGYVSISPHHINRTAHAHFDDFTRWTAQLSVGARV